MFTRRHHTLVIELTRVTAIAVAMLMLTVLIVTRSQAAFSDSTDNTANSFSTGKVALTDDDSTNALFSATGMTPGTPVVECIEITYEGDLTPADIKMYGTSTGALAPYLNTTIELGTGGGYGDCASFTQTATLYSSTLAKFSESHTGWADGLDVFTAAANPTAQTLRFTIDVEKNESAQGQSASADFTFEAQD